jgi:hypothetical protein
VASDIDQDRRRWLGTAAMTVAAAGFGELGPATMLMADALPARPPNTKGRTATSFGPLKQIDAGLLNIGYAEAGPPTGVPVMLLHGWPYDIHSFADVAPLLATAGFRVIVPHLRGHGTTRFLSSATIRNAQQSVVALDIVALMDALKIERAILAGYDWEHARPTSSPRSGRSAVRRWCR